MTNLREFKQTLANLQYWVSEISKAILQHQTNPEFLENQTRYRWDAILMIATQIEKQLEMLPVDECRMYAEPMIRDAIICLRERNPQLLTMAAKYLVDADGLLYCPEGHDEATSTDALEATPTAVVRAETQKLFPKGKQGIDKYLVALALELQTQAGTGKSMSQIAEEFAISQNFTAKDGKSFLRSIRALRAQGRVKLPGTDHFRKAQESKQKHSPRGDLDDR